MRKRPGFGWSNTMLVAALILPSVLASPMPEAAASLPGGVGLNSGSVEGNSGLDNTALSPDQSKVNLMPTSTSSAGSSDTTSSSDSADSTDSADSKSSADPTDTADATDASATESSAPTETPSKTDDGDSMPLSTELPVTVPTQNTWVEQMLGYNKDQRKAFDHLTYAFEQDGLDETSALTFAQVMEFQEAVWEKIDNRLTSMETKEVLIIALVAGGIGGFLLCGVMYTIYACFRCNIERRRAKKQRKLEERNSFVMINPGAQKNGKKEKDGKDYRSGSDGSSTSTAVSSNTATSSPPSSSVAAKHQGFAQKPEEWELQNRSAPPNSKAGHRGLLSSKNHPTGMVSAAPRLTVTAASSVTGSNINNNKNAHTSTGSTSISDILAEFEFDVDEDAKERDEINATSNTGNNNSTGGTGGNTGGAFGLGGGGSRHYYHWGLGRPRTSASDEGSQIGIVSGKDVHKKEGRFYRKSRGMHL